jgi:hypothetical protein
MCVGNRLLLRVGPFIIAHRYIYADLDYRNTSWAGRDPETVACAVRHSTGRGLQDGRKVALIDPGGQGGLSRWWNRRTAPAAEGNVQRGAPDLLQFTAPQPRCREGAASTLRPGGNRFPGVGARDDPRRRRGVRPGAYSLSAHRRRPGRSWTYRAPSLHGVVDHGFVLTQVPAVRAANAHFMSLREAKCGRMRPNETKLSGKICAAHVRTPFGLTHPRGSTLMALRGAGRAVCCRGARPTGSRHR